MTAAFLFRIARMRYNTLMDGTQKEDSKTAAQPAPEQVISPQTATQPVEQAQPPKEDTGFWDKGATPATTEDREDYDTKEEITWSGPEFVSHEKPQGWYAIIMFAAIVLAGGFYLLARDFITSITILLAITIVGAYGMRRPKVINYKLSRQGIDVGTKHFYYESFRSFTANQEGIYLNITFMPLQRFSPGIGMCCSAKEQEQVMDFLADMLPYEHREPDILEKLMQRIHF